MSDRISAEERAAAAAGSVETLLEALPYIREFHGRTVVIKYGGAAMRDPQIKHALIRDARARGADGDPLARRLLALAQARSCSKRRIALAALAGEAQPTLRIMLSLLGSSRCLSREARRMLQDRGAPEG